MTTRVATRREVSNSPAPAARRAGWFGWWFYVLVIVIAPFALILAGAVTVYLWWKLADVKASHDVDLEVARIQAAGEPVTIYDLYAYHQVPDGTKDITAIWVAALRLYDGKQYAADCQPLPIVGAGDQAGLDSDAPNNQIDAAEAFLIKHDAIVQATLVAAREPGECRLPTNFGAGGAAAGAPHLEQSQSLARTMSLRMRVNIARGKNGAAIESIEASLAAVRAQQHQLTLGEYFYRREIVGRAMKDVQFLLAEAELTDEQLVRLQGDVQSLDARNSLTTALVGERGAGFRRFHTPPPLTPQPATRIATAADPMAGGKLTRATDCKFFFEIIQEQIDASGQPLPQSTQTAHQIHERIHASMQKASNLLEIMRHAQTVKFLPMGTAAIDSRARIEAWRNLTLAAIAAERYRLKHGEYPPDLAALPEFISAIPSDPYDGQPLRMIVTPAGVTFYSIGRDEKDDGGIDNGDFNPQDHNELDIVVRLTNP